MFFLRTPEGDPTSAPKLPATLPETPPEAVDSGGLQQELPDFDPGFTIRRSVDGSFVVSGARIERAAAMTYWDHDEAVLRFQHILETLGVSGGLESAGVQAGDTVYIGEDELEWSE